MTTKVYSSHCYRGCMSPWALLQVSPAGTQDQGAALPQPLAEGEGRWQPTNGKHHIRSHFIGSTRPRPAPQGSSAVGILTPPKGEIQRRVTEQGWRALPRKEGCWGLAVCCPRSLGLGQAVVSRLSITSPVGFLPIYEPGPPSLWYTVLIQPSSQKQ